MRILKILTIFLAFILSSLLFLTHSISPVFAIECGDIVRDSNTTWKANCGGGSCYRGEGDHSACAPGNDWDSSNINQLTSYQCYGFEGPAHSSEDFRCITLVRNICPSRGASGCGGGGQCNATDRQSPSHTGACQTCIINQKGGTLVQDIKNLDHSQFDACNDTQLVNYWCNGGIGQPAQDECNGFKNGACKSACGGGSGNVTISGKVTSNTGQGIPNVTLNCDSLPFTRPTTDSNGNFSVSNVPSGTAFCLRGPQISGYRHPPATVQGNNVDGQSFECQTAGRYSDPDSCNNQNGTNPAKSVDMNTDNQYNFVYTANPTAPPDPITVKWYRIAESRFEANDATPAWKDYNPAAEPIKEGLKFPDNTTPGQIKTVFAQFKDSNNRVSRVFQNSIIYRPQTGPTCNSLAPVGLTDTGNIDSNGRKIYRMDSNGGVARINASRSPSTTVMSGSSTPSLTFNPDAGNDGSIVATIPANTNTTQDVDYTVSATVGSPPVTCTPAGFVIRVTHATPRDSACNNFAPAGLTETGQFDYAGRRIYRTGDSSGGNVRISATRTPSDAGMTGFSTPEGVTFDRDVANPGAIVGVVPPNTSTASDKEYVIKATIPGASGSPANCNPEFIIRVPKKQADTSCPYTSTEVKAKVGGLWLSQNVSITKGESIRIAGFHNGNTSGPPDDIILEYRGPNGETGSFSTNDQTFTPAQNGTYTFTARTRDKTGANCEGTSAFAVSAQAASSCTGFTPIGLTDSGNIDGEGRKYYQTGDSSGGNVPITATRSPSGAVMTGSNSTGVTLRSDVANPGGLIGAVPSNNSTAQDANHLITATIPGNSGTLNCSPAFYIRVPKAQTDRSCPSNIESTQVKFLQGNLWLKENVSIQKGSSIRIAGFHNDDSAGTPPADIFLKYTGPNGETGSFSTNDQTFTPAQNGNYTFTAKTREKTGANCEGTSVFTVNAQTATACTAFSPNGLQEDSQTGPNGMKIYKLPDYKGGRRLLNVTRSPADAAITPSFTKSPVTASDLSFENMADGSGNKVVNIGDNDSTSQNSEYTVSATVTGVGTKQCTPFMIQVPKKPLVTACPDEIKSTEARIKVSDDDFWSKENTLVVGNRVFVGGFHNGTDTPANDAVLTVTGPEGPKSRVVTLNPNTEHVASFKPDLAGRYTVTASTFNKDGAKCTGTGVLTVDPGTSCPSDITSTEARMRGSDKEAWSSEKEMTLGSSILVAGFHNKQTDELASDIVLKATGPEGPQSSVKVINNNNNNISFKPTLAGNYRITAVKKGKSGDNCAGSSTLKVSPPAVTTTSFRIAESPADLETAPWQPYTAEGMRVEYDFKKAGDKFIFVQFIDSTGKTTTVKDCPKCQLQIKVLGPDPQVLSCSLSTSGNSVLATLKGRNFGKDKGTVKSGDSNLTVKSWKDDAVEAVLSNPAVGETLPVEVVNTEGQASSGAICSSLSTLSVGASFFCHSRQDRAQSNIDLALVEQTPGAKPLKQKVTIDKEGVIAGLTGILQEGKDYKLSLKGPRTVRKTKLFTAGSGTTNVPDFILPVGDIFPLGGDGVINSLDKAELNRQWVISKDVKERAADFNNDGRVNSIDWACMRKDFGSSSDTEPAAPTGTASSCSINALGKPLDPKQTFEDPNTVQFITSATYSGKKSIAAARWDFQNKGEWDTDLNAESVSPYYTYPAAGEYTVRLQVQLSDGEMTPVCTKKITVPIPTAGSADSSLSDQNFTTKTENGITVSLSCTGTNLKAYVTGEIPSPTDRNVGLYSTLVDTQTNQTMIYEYNGNQGSPTTRIAANFPPTGSIVGSSFPVLGDGRTYQVKVYSSPFNTAGLTLTNLVAQTSFSKTCP